MLILQDSKPYTISINVFWNGIYIPVYPRKKYIKKRTKCGHVLFNFYLIFLEALRNAEVGKVCIQSVSL